MLKIARCANLYEDTAILVKGSNIMSSPLVGAWEIVSDVYQGFVVYSENHYGDAFTAKNRKLFQGSEPTESEEAEAYRSMMAASGTYTISGPVVTRNEEFSRLPHGSPQPFEFSIDGDQMTMKHVESGRAWHFRKVT